MPRRDGQPLDKQPVFRRRLALPRLPKHPVFPRGPRALQAQLREPERVGTRPGPKPTAGPLALATLPEWAIYWALTVRLKKVPGIDFEYRGEVAANTLSAAAQLDFTMLDGSAIAIEVQGIHWHYELGSTKIAEDLVRATELASRGWTIVNIDEDDALADPEHYVREALRGRDHSYRYQGTSFRRT
jgi:hypothetical protein